jgi:hypothetical protein
VERAEVGVLEEADEVGLGRLLERGDGGALEAQAGLAVLPDLADEALEGALADDELRRLLIPEEKIVKLFMLIYLVVKNGLSDLAERDRARAVAVRLLDAARRGRRVARRLGRELLARGLAARRLASRLPSCCVVVEEV